MSGGVATMISGRWKAGKVEATTTHPARGMMITVRDLVDDSIYTVHVSQTREAVIHDGTKTYFSF